MRRNKKLLPFLSVCGLVGASLAFQTVKNNNPYTEQDNMVMMALNSGILPTSTPIPEIKENIILLTERKKIQSEVEAIKLENSRMASVISRGNERKTSPLLDYDKLSCPRYIVELMERMCKAHGFESIREIYAIVGYESNFDPTQHATKGEDSRGLLQVNVADKHHAARHPRKDKLYDAAYNLDYQLDELSQYYKLGKKKGLKCVDLTCFISKNGQRPRWSNSIKQQIQKWDKEYLSAIVKEEK